MIYNQEPIFLQPVFQERIWGGAKLRSEYGYEIPSEQTGEAWAISAHPNGPSIIQNGPLAGKTLLDAWQEQRALFGNVNNEDYPLLVKILDAKTDLSVQVHPNDTYAKEVEQQPYGKTECWYVLQADEGAEIVFGHHAKTKAAFDQLIEEKNWDQLLRRVPAKKGDFIYVPSGAIHAIGAGIMILETQQSSDITYRVYDYDRTDNDGNPRELHLESAKEVSTVPHETMETRKQAEQIAGLTQQQLVQNEYFTVYHWSLNGEAALEAPEGFLQVSITEGAGELKMNEKAYPLTKGTHFILPASAAVYHISGQFEAVVSHL